jgi:hypothetical protein
MKSGPLVNVARNRVVYQSSSADDDHAGHLVTDGSNQTYWESKADGDQWISVDLGASYLIDRITIQWGHSYPRLYRIDISTDADRPSHWTTTYTTTTGTGGLSDLLLDSVIAQHIRLFGSTREIDRGLSVIELKAWTSGTAASPKLSSITANRKGALLDRGWLLQCSIFTMSKPADISSPEFEGVDWIPAVVPGTVLASYLAIKAIPDPHFGNRVAEISDGFFSRNDFWYRNTFRISPECKGRRLWLTFDGINWKAEVYLNGNLLGQIDGAFIRQRFDITAMARCGDLNCVAVLIRQVAHPGSVLHKKLGEQYQNGGIIGLDSPTFVPSIGWNWLPTIPGRNIGIWNEVRFETSGDLLLLDPWVTSVLSAKDSSRAELSARTEVMNLAGDARRCVLCLDIDKLSVRHEFELQPYETRSVTVDKDICPALAIDNPRLWWPNGYGAPILHSMKFRIEFAGVVSDEREVTFGIRNIEYRSEGGVLRMFVNGCPILCRGGNWGMDDAMLVCDKDGYDLRVRMHRDCNLNMIRNWVGMVGRNAFYDACDRYGVLIWDDFWLANPVDAPDPADHVLFMNNAIDKIRRVRHHASLVLYCGRNEGLPPADIDAGLRDATSRFDGTRYYIPASDRGLVTGRGPYDNQDPTWYFENRGSTFHSEQGIVCIPSEESLREMMPEENLWPISDMWAIHDYQNPRSVLNTKRIGQRYGEPVDLADYCRKAQMVNFETAKALYECLQSRQGGGQLIWMSQSAWPALICQLYDYYFEQTAAYFGAKVACEPVHILWDQASNIVKVANNTPVDRRDLCAETWIYDLEGRQHAHETFALNIPAVSVHDCFSLSDLHRPDDMFFVKLRLSHGGEGLSENFYWSPDPSGHCTALNALPELYLPVSSETNSTSDEFEIAATVSNPTRSVAVAVHLKILRDGSNTRVLPALYEDNYFSLLPGDKKTVHVRFPHNTLNGAKAWLAVEGWNVKPARYDLR